MRLKNKQNILIIKCKYNIKILLYDDYYIDEDFTFRS